MADDDGYISNFEVKQELALNLRHHLKYDAHYYIDAEILPH